MDTVLNIKKYNLMDSLNAPIQGFVLWPLNTLNFAVGMVQGLDLNVLSAIIGITLNFMWHLYKLFRQIELDKQADKRLEFDQETLKRTCVNCKNVFETQSATQVFCSPECRTAFSEDAHSRRP